MACLLAGWGIARHLYLVRPDLSVHGAAGHPATLRFLLWTLRPEMALRLPAPWYLFRVFRGGHPAREEL